MKACINQQCDYVDITGETFVSYVLVIVLCMGILLTAIMHSVC